MEGFQPVEQYATCEHADPVLYGDPEKDWNPNAFGSIKIWSITPLTDAQILEEGGAWIKSFQDDEISAQTAIRGLKLALSLKSTNSTNATPLLVQQTRPVEQAPRLKARVTIPALDTFPAGAYTLAAQPVEEQGENGQAILPFNNQNQNQDYGPNTDADRVKLKAYGFLAAFMMKLLIKSNNNILQSLATMKRRYESFYGSSSTVRLFALTSSKVSAYKAALSSQYLIHWTYTHAIANTHQEHFNQMETMDQGVLSYLCILHFSYSGLHSYTLMIELKNHVKMRLNMLLSWFHSDIMAPALLKIANIVTNMERTVAFPGRNVTFRYCTHWGPEYFLSLRSKHCPHLLFTLACVWNLMKSNHKNSNPENIMAINTLSLPMKATLRSAARFIANNLTKRVIGGVGASPAFVHALAIRRRRMRIRERRIGKMFFDGLKSSSLVLL